MPCTTRHQTVDVVLSRTMHVLVMICTNPGSGGDHCDEANGDRDDTPSEHNLWRVLHDVSLERADDEEDEPCDTGGGAAGVDTTDVLKEACPEDTHPEWSPL